MASASTARLQISKTLPAGLRPLRSRRRRVAAGMKVNAFLVTLITPDGKQHEIDCPEDTTVLEAAEEAGVELEYSCQSGSCSSCMGKTIKGAVDQEDQSILDEDQVARGWTCLCVAYPIEDCVIETNKQDEFMLEQAS